MTDISSGRLIAPHVSEVPSSGGNAAGAYPWTSPKKAVNPYLEPGCACSTGTSAYRRMTNGVNGTDSSEKWHIY